MVHPTVFARVTVNRGLVQLISRSASSFRFTNACNSVSAPIPGGCDFFNSMFQELVK